MDPMKVLRTAAAMGARPKRLFIVGCQPATPQSADDQDGCEMPIGMSAPVLAAVDGAIALVQSLVNQLSGDSATQGLGNPQEVSDDLDERRGSASVASARGGVG